MELLKEGEEETTEKEGDSIVAQVLTDCHGGTYRIEGRRARRQRGYIRKITRSREDFLSVL